MAEGKWKEINPSEIDFISQFYVDGKGLAGYIVRRAPGGYYAAVLPSDGGNQTPTPKEVADNVSEAEAKAAVEEYWATRNPDLPAGRR